MDKKLIEHNLYQIIDQFNERKSKSRKSNSIFLNKTYQFYDRTGRACRILFANDDIIRQSI